MKKVILLIIVLVIAAGGWYAYNEYNRKNVDLKKEDAAFKISALELITIFEKDSASANAKYLDKIVAVDGRIKKIDAQENPVIIFLGDASVMSSVQCSMDSTYAQDYKALKEGDTVTIKGMVTGAITDEIFGTDVKLNRCIIQL